MIVKIAAAVGAFAEDKDAARRLRVEVIEPAVAARKAVTIDFSGVDLATQSFVHALICDVVRKHGADALNRITFKGCNATLKSLIKAVTEYSQESPM
jgi:hypothetical protein